MSATFEFRLYVAGSGPNSLLAVANLSAFCAEQLPDRHHIEVVDVVREPERALKDGILMTPTLVKLAPEPIRRIIGNLSERGALVQALAVSPS